MTARGLTRLALLTIVIGLIAHPALAQLVHRPFALPGGESGGAPSGVGGWILAVAAWLNHLLVGEIKALHSDSSAIWGLLGLSAAYGVFHAAGPGHGKALIASYVFANERALRRGLVLSLLAALLQACVAVGLVGAAALIFRATASAMINASAVVEVGSYLCVVAIGGWLVWSKGRALAGALRLVIAQRAHGAAFAQAPWRPAFAMGAASQFRAESPGASAAMAIADCGHVHAPDPRDLGGAFSWRSAFATVVAAGARPCSAAIVVLTFTLAQRLFLVGIAATFAMALGTAITTGALAALAVFAKDAAMRLAGRETARAALIALSLQFAAALVVLAYGLALLIVGPIGAG